MPDDVVLVDHSEQIAIITLHRPDKLNAVTRAMADAYAQRMRDADADPDVRAIVVTGAGRGFCAGADLDVLRTGPETLADFLPAIEDFPDLALRLRTPVIAAVNGPVAGIGFRTCWAVTSDLRPVVHQSRRRSPGSGWLPSMGCRGCCRN
jgi:enoyl-CoA hydratase/carnithine racemase